MGLIFSAAPFGVWHNKDVASDTKVATKTTPTRYHAILGAPRTG